MLAESDLALIVDNLLMGCEGFILLSQVLRIVLIKFIYQLVHDVLGLGGIDLLRGLLAVQSRRPLALVGVSGGLRKYEAMQGLLIAL